MALRFRTVAGITSVLVIVKLLDAQAGGLQQDLRQQPLYLAPFHWLQFRHAFCVEQQVQLSANRYYDRDLDDIHGAPPERSRYRSGSACCGRCQSIVGAIQ
jgi:hypothetical protein